MIYGKNIQPCLVGVGQAGGSVEIQVSLLHQSHQGQVVTIRLGVIVLRVNNHQVHSEILRDQRLVQSVQLVFAQSDYQFIFREMV